LQQANFIGPFLKQPYSLSLHYLQVLILTLHTLPTTTLHLGCKSIPSKDGKVTWKSNSKSPTNGPGLANEIP